MEKVWLGSKVPVWYLQTPRAGQPVSFGGVDAKPVGRHAGWSACVLRRTYIPYARCEASVRAAKAKAKAKATPTKRNHKHAYAVNRRRRQTPTKPTDMPTRVIGYVSPLLVTTHQTKMVVESSSRKTTSSLRARKMR